MIHKIPDRLGSYKMADGAIGEILVLEKGKERGRRERERDIEGKEGPTLRDSVEVKVS